MNRLGPFDENTIVTGDCLDIMAQMPDGCVDLVVTDPPYGIKKDYGVPDMQPGVDIWLEVNRVLKQDGHLSLTVSNRHLCTWLDRLREAGFTYLHASVYWNSARCAGNFQGRFAYAWEPWLHLVKSLEYQPLIKRMRSDVVMHLGHKTTDHPAERDYGAWYYMVSHLPGDLIFDPFIGSGTTAVVADRLGRNFFGCDINPDYVEMTLKRLEKDRAGRQLQLL